MLKKQNADQKALEARANSRVIWEASEERPISLYYCKARLCDGDTQVIMQDNVKVFCEEVEFVNCSGNFSRGNTTGKAKASGAKTALQIFAGRVYRLK